MKTNQTTAAPRSTITAIVCGKSPRVAFRVVTHSGSVVILDPKKETQAAIVRAFENYSSASDPFAERWLAEAWAMYRAGIPGAFGRLRFALSELVANRPADAPALMADPRGICICLDKDYAKLGKPAAPSRVPAEDAKPNSPGQARDVARLILFATHDPKGFASALINTIDTPMGNPCLSNRADAPGGKGRQELREDWALSFLLAHDNGEMSSHTDPATPAPETKEG